MGQESPLRHIFITFWLLQQEKVSLKYDIQPSENKEKVVIPRLFQTNFVKK